MLLVRIRDNVDNSNTFDTWNNKETNRTLIRYHSLFQESLMNFKGDWDAILWSDLGMPKETIVDILRQRPEFQEDPYLTPNQKLAMKKLAPFVVSSDDCISKIEEWENIKQGE